MKTLHYNNKEYYEFYIENEPIYLPKNILENMEYYGDIKERYYTLTIKLNSDKQSNTNNETNIETR